MTETATSTRGAARHGRGLRREAWGAVQLAEYRVRAIASRLNLPARDRLALLRTANDLAELLTRAGMR
jgi:hypothetical protein